MTDKNYTDLTIVLDRSGSMSSFGSEVITSINAFLEKQKKEVGKCLVTLIQFDSANRYDVVLDKVDIKNARLETFDPRGTTPLYDCLGRAINDAGARFKSMAESERPANVVFLIMTDGFENASVEFTSEQVKGMVQTQENEFNWNFVYLGANQNAMVEGAKFGTSAAKSANFKSFDSALDVYSNKLSRSRGLAASGASLQAIKASHEYTQEEREKTEA